MGNNKISLNIYRTVETGNIGGDLGIGMGSVCGGSFGKNIDEAVGTVIKYISQRTHLLKTPVEMRIHSRASGFFGNTGFDKRTLDYIASGIKEVYNGMNVIVD